MMLGITIGDKHTGTDWGLNWIGITLPMPAPKLNTISVPGFDGSIDRTEFSGRIAYENREGAELKFSVNDGSPAAWHARYSAIANYLHGKKRKVILDTDAGFYYIDRLSINEEKTDYFMSQIVISGTFEPYKYELQSSLEDWLWDPFSFEDGIIREYRNLTVNGSLAVIIPGREMLTVPVIQSSTVMSVSNMGKSYEVKAGSNKIYGIKLGPGDNILTFTGNGTVSIDYRGGSL